MTLKRGKGPTPKYARIAAVVACAVCLGLGVGFRQEVYALVKNIGYTLNTFINAGNIADYVQVINTSVADNGYTVTLNEVVIDNDEIIITKTITSDAPLGSEMVSAFGAIYVNGKAISDGMSGAGKKMDAHTYQDMAVFDISHAQLALETENHISYQLREITAFPDAQPQNTSGKWDFAFKATGEQLAVDTKAVALDETIILPDGCAVKLTKYTSNSFGQKIYFELADGEKGFDYQMELRGTDDLGNPVVFYLSSLNRGRGILKVEAIENGYVHEDAQVLHFTVHVAENPKESGRMNQDYQQLDDALALEIQ